MFDAPCMMGLDNHGVLKLGIVLQRPTEEGGGAYTTLQAYFFGKDGEKKLQYQDFRR